MTTNDNRLDLMLRWNNYCISHDRDWDCILLNEDRTYVEAFESSEQAMREIVNSSSPEFKRNEGFLVTVWSVEGRYAGMRYVQEGNIGRHIDLSLIS